MNTFSQNIQTTSHASTRRPLFVVANDPDERVLATVADAAQHDVVFVEAVTRAYSKIKRVAPGLIVLCLTFDDMEAYRLMSMLKVDPETAPIPVVTCLLEPVAAHSYV
jgi:CheY-like chemotaxis protein